MGCGSSRGSAAVMPMDASLATNGAAHALAALPAPPPQPAPALVGREPPAEQLPEDPPRDPPRELPSYKDVGHVVGVVVAFEVPLSDEQPGSVAEQPVPRRPPRRLQRLEDAPPPPSQRLTHKLLDERQEAADERRSQILSQRVQSAQQRAPIRRPRDSNGSSDAGLASSGSIGGSRHDSAQSTAFEESPDEK